MNILDTTRDRRIRSALATVSMHARHAQISLMCVMHVYGWLATACGFPANGASKSGYAGAKLS